LISTACFRNFHFITRLTEISRPFSMLQHLYSYMHKKWIIEKLFSICKYNVQCKNVFIMWEFTLEAAALLCHKLVKFFFNSRSGGGVQTGSTQHVGHWMANCTCPRWLWWWRNWWNEDWQGKPKYSEKTCPSATSSTTNPT
jgi:hypothetical protein